jgi:hypothetical protein
MADVGWGAGICILPQSEVVTGDGGFGNPNSTIQAAGDGGSVTEADGAVLGVGDQGTGNSGITIPNHVREVLDRPDVPGSFTRTPNAFIRSVGEGLQIIFDLKGNGEVVQAGGPTLGEAKPALGIDAILQAAGLEGSNEGTGPYKYKPRSNTQYASVRLFMGEQGGNGLAYTYQDCIVETLAIPNEGGEATVITASISIGSIIDTVELGLPSFDYGTQATLSPPTNQLADFTYGTARCHQTFGVTITNTIEEFSCSNAANGKRLDQSERSIDFAGSIMMESTNTDFEWTELIGNPTTSITWQYGAGDPHPNRDGAATSENDVYNRIAYSCGGAQLDSVNYDRAGSKTTVEVEGHCTSIVAGGEFTLQYE